MALLALAVQGCELPAGQSLPTETPEVEPTPEPELTATRPRGTTPLTFWEPFPLDRPEGLLLTEMVHGFEKDNPDIQVELVAKSGYTGLHESMLAELPGGVLPDLGVAFPSMIAQYAAAGVIAPLDDFLQDPELGLSSDDLADMYAAGLQAGRLPGASGALVGFPFAQNAVGMWVNQTLLRKAGWKHPPITWSEFEQACYDVWAATGTRCYPVVENVTTFQAWLLSRGGRFLNDAGDRAAFNSAAGVESLSLLRRLLDVNLAWRPDDPYGDYAAFANGEAAFAFSSTGNSSLYVDAYNGVIQNGAAPFEWTQTLVPQSDPTQASTALYGAEFFVIRGDTENEQAAWRLIRWLTSARQTALWAGQLEALPVRASALAVLTDTLQTYPFVRQQVEEILPYARPGPALAAELEVNEIVYTAIVSVTHGYADPQTALDQAAQKADAILAGSP